MARGSRRLLCAQVVRFQQAVHIDLHDCYIPPFRQLKSYQDSSLSLGIRACLAPSLTAPAHSCEYMSIDCTSVPHGIWLSTGHFKKFVLPLSISPEKLQGLGFAQDKPTRLRISGKSSHLHLELRSSSTFNEIAMAMSMTDFFYGDCDSRHRFYSSESRPSRPDRCTVPTFELTVPMCCTTCEEQATEALFDLECVVDVVSDPYNNRLCVTGYVDPMRALKQARHAALQSHSSHGHHPDVECLPLEKTYQERSTYLQRGHSQQRNPSRSVSSYSSSYCPSYRDSSSTHYVALNTNNVRRVEYGY